MEHERVGLTNHQAEGLRKCRQEANYPQKKIADLLNVSQHTISNWECGNTRTVPRIELQTLLGFYYLQTEGSIKSLFQQYDLLLYFDYAEIE